MRGKKRIIIGPRKTRGSHHLKPAAVAVVLVVCLTSGMTFAQQTGEQLFSANCARCHAGVEIERRLRGEWSGRTAGQLFERTRQTMPAESPGSLSDDDYIKLTAYMLDVGGMPTPIPPLTAANLDSVRMLFFSVPTDVPDDVPWRTMHGDLNANRYSPLDQINADNASQLDIEWRHRPRPHGHRCEDDP